MPDSAASRGTGLKDPDGFDVAVTNGTRALRRKRSTSITSRSEVPDFRRSAAFYQALLGWTIRLGNANQASVQIGSIAGAIIRGNAATRARTAAGDSPAAAAASAAAMPKPASGVTAAIGHISYGIEHWDTERVRAELKKRDVAYTNREGQREPRPDMTGTLESFHVPDAMGWDLQIGNKIAPNR